MASMAPYFDTEDKFLKWAMHRIQRRIIKRKIYLHTFNSERNIDWVGAKVIVHQATVVAGVFSSYTLYVQGGKHLGVFDIESDTRTRFDDLSIFEPLKEEWRITFIHWAEYMQAWIHIFR